jgi:small GTP-binding protein
MISKKICMLGGFSVGKTSLVDRYVHSIFTDKYLSTVGVKISKKVVPLGETEVTLVLWDMEGKDIFANVNLAYLRGCMGFFVVADGTRKETLDLAVTLRETALGAAGNVPGYLLVNKADIRDKWEVTEEMLAPLIDQGILVLCTSAKTGENVDAAFSGLAKSVLG